MIQDLARAIIDVFQLIQLIRHLQIDIDDLRFCVILLIIPVGIPLAGQIAIYQVLRRITVAWDIFIRIAVATAPLITLRYGSRSVLALTCSLNSPLPSVS